jgi:hypothetical protein
VTTFDQLSYQKPPAEASFFSEVEVAKCRSPRLDCLADTGGLMRRKIVDHHDVVPLEGRGETALDVGHESTVHCPVDCTRRRHAILAQSGNEGDRLPMTLWLKVQQPLAAGATAVKAIQAAPVERSSPFGPGCAGWTAVARPAGRTTLGRSTWVVRGCAEC